MSSDDEDEDFKLAVALSLQENSSAAPPVSVARHETVDLTSDTEDEDEDDDLRRAVALSLQESEPVVRTDNVVREVSLPSQHDTTAGDARKDSTKPPAAISESKASTSTTGPVGIMGLDRKAMEQERLARLGKRKREPSPDRPSKQIGRTPSSETSSSFDNLQYSRGTVKRTFATKYPRTDDITIDEVLQASSVNIAVISSFMWDTEWVYKKLDPTKVKQIWIMNAKDQDVQERWVREMKETGVPNLKIHFPPMDGMIHSMHSKFMLLFGKAKLRFVVPTANMTQIDWGEVANDWQPGVMENSVFLIDLPRRSDEAIGSRMELPRFGQELVYFLEQQKVGQNVIEGVLKFDFSQTGHLAFVHAIGSAHNIDSHPTGLPGLTQAIQDLQLDNVKDIELDYAASSLGAINDTFLQRIYLAACGEPFTTDSNSSHVRDHIRIYFPTNDTVEKSIGGRDCGGIISLTRQHYNATTFPKECLRDYDSTRRGMLSHNKLLFARGRKKDGKPFAWVYIGSANVSESAWGGQKVLKSGRMGSLNVRNWECGVVVAVPDSRMKGVVPSKDTTIPPMSVFEGTVEVPFVCPGQSYQGREPWFFRTG
ncbi:tyrosyl-DNA phosphodiesterase domain-containing protein [Cucurbitaria berberidis CBS 394.84]|uniref:Tyrosyl-DNA phosphodiesterase domain-containing protein n=1 Tax=Cucurbitaria berberidis CBS 394.84 TaxID=1168544 RepID=A0A9P4GMH2_9PLEO|nr:tyrosyl-DNA phosphodiesterase domain-containing protein [Cucurbitaria berberidis CBS 394.84]KAF1847766.1 tyrosyl-DNA phosphodiesterase domain-containing protein [Cucurbitaria berberidis CBS 394.84]